MTDHEKVQEVIDQASEYVVAALEELQIECGGVLINAYCPGVTPNAAAVVLGFEDPAMFESYLLSQLEAMTGYEVHVVPKNQG